MPECSTIAWGREVRPGVSQGDFPSIGVKSQYRVAVGVDVPFCLRLRAGTCLPVATHIERSFDPPEVLGALAAHGRGQFYLS